MPPDPLPSWRDPNMPVYLRGHYFPAIEIQRQAIRNIAKARFSGRPGWRNDPTYNLRKRTKL